MGKAQIIEALGEGRYTIRILEARERAEAIKGQALSRISAINAEISDLDAQIAAAQNDVDAAVTAEQNGIEQYRQEMANDGESTIDLSALARAVLEAALKRDRLRTQQSTKELLLASDRALIERINALPPLREIQAWCADYTDDLSCEVATAEVPGEIGKVIIKPGAVNEANGLTGNEWSPVNDGAIQPALSSTPAGAFYNLAMFPGWQKWRPTYRIGTITALEGSTCRVSIDSETSSQQGLNVNAQTVYDSVPILYMECNGSVFSEGDRVLVAFAGNIDTPVVVGFEKEPRACQLPFGTLYYEEDLTPYGYAIMPGLTFSINPLHGYQEWVQPGVIGMRFRMKGGYNPSTIQFAIRIGGNRSDNIKMAVIYRCDDSGTPQELIWRSGDFRWVNLTNGGMPPITLPESFALEANTIYMIAVISYWKAVSQTQPTFTQAAFDIDTFSQENTFVEVFQGPTGGLPAYDDYPNGPEGSVSNMISVANNIVGKAPDYEDYKSEWGKGGFDDFVFGLPEQYDSHAILFAFDPDLIDKPFPE
jgi:hypothetical protein